MANPQVRDLIRRLQEQNNRALEVFAQITESDLARSDSHGCAVGGTLGGLLAHNVEHDRMHTGQIATKRWELGVMPQDPAHRLLAELVRERAALISTLIGLPDDALDRRPEAGETTLREVVEHVLYWDGDSVEHAAAHVLENADHA
jgi:hypothetical protein